MDIRINFLFISLDAILTMWRLRWQLANWSRIDLLFSYLEIFMYGASLFKFFLRIQTILAINCGKTITEMNIPFSGPSSPLHQCFFQQACKKTTLKSGGGGTTNAWSFFAFLPLIYGKDYRCKKLLSLRKYYKYNLRNNRCPILVSMLTSCLCIVSINILQNKPNKY